MTRARVRLAALGLVVAVVGLAALSPLRDISGDTAPGRLGGLVLRCAGSFDLARVDFIRAELEHQRTYYFLHYDTAEELTSVFGPVPAIVGALALVDVGSGDTISSHSLRARERLAAAVLLGLSALLVLIAALAQAGVWRALATASVAALSFAGLATLGQGLWQATTALPLLAGALATLAWRDRHARIALATPALLAVAVMLRPTIAPLVLGLGITWAREARDRRTWLIATAVAAVAIAPLVAWNAIHLNSPLPLGQLVSNQRMTSSVFSFGGAGVGIAGLLVSPARGLVWFAPIVLVGTVAGLRDPRWRALSAGIVLQLVAMAIFFKWHGGQAFGPRLLAEATWLSTFLALAVPMPSSRRAHVGVAVAVAVTCIVGQLGLWLWHPAQWETRRLPDRHPAALWDIADSPLTSLTRTLPAVAPASDLPPRSRFVCGSTITTTTD